MPLQIQLTSSTRGRLVPAYRLAQIARLSRRAFDKDNRQDWSRNSVPGERQASAWGRSRVSQSHKLRVLRGGRVQFSRISLVQWAVRLLDLECFLMELKYVRFVMEEFWCLLVSLSGF